MSDVRSATTRRRRSGPLSRTTAITHHERRGRVDLPARCSRRSCRLIWIALSAQNPPVAWSVERFEEWFLDVIESPEAAQRCRAKAHQRGISDLGSDLLSEWYLSIVGTISTWRAGGSGPPNSVSDETSAWKYILRALDNDACDLGRRTGRSPISFTTLGDEQHEFDPAIEDVGGGSTGSPEFTATWSTGQDDMRRELGQLLASGRAGCRGCAGSEAVAVALGVLELHDVGFLPPGDGSSDDIRGGATYWDKLVYEFLRLRDPSRVSTTAGRLSASTRKWKERCGKCARELLRVVALSALPDPDERGVTGS